MTELISAPEGISPGQDQEKRRSPGRLIIPAMAVAGFALLFCCYLRMSLTVAPTSDGAANVLQAWDMLHGNVLLHGWALSDVSFYTTELPEYMTVELARGLNADVVNIAGALTYTLLVLMAALLAKGNAAGREGYARMLLAAGIMVSPQLMSGVSVLILQPDHVGSTIPVLAAWLVIDRAGRRPWVPAVVGLVLAWALAGDAIVLYIGIAPMLVVSLMRAYQEIVQRQSGWRAAWFELWLAAAGVAALALGMAVPVLIRLLGGYHVADAPAAFTGGNLIASAQTALHGLLLLYGANFYRLSYSFAAGLVLLHLIGLGLAGWAFGRGLRRFTSLADPIAQFLVAGTVIILAAYIFGAKAGNLATTREIAAVLPYGAVLAARLLAARLLAARLMPALAVVLAGYVLTLAVNLPARPAPLPDTGLRAWLAGHGYRYGLGDYWLANDVTVDSKNQVCIRAVTTGSSLMVPFRWESRDRWYDPTRHAADFVVLSSVPGQEASRAWLTQLTSTFGFPARTYHVGDYTVLIWSYNLLTQLPAFSEGRS